MPVTALLDWVASLRRVDARDHANAFEEQLAAARGDESGVRAVRNSLAQAATSPGARRRGNLADLARMLGSE